MAMEGLPYSFFLPISEYFPEARDYRMYWKAAAFRSDVNRCAGRSCLIPRQVTVNTRLFRHFPSCPLLGRVGLEGGNEEAGFAPNSLPTRISKHLLGIKIFRRCLAVVIQLIAQRDGGFGLRRGKDLTVLFDKEFEQQIIPNCIDKFFGPLPSESVWRKPSAALILCVTDVSGNIYQIGSPEFPCGCHKRFSHRGIHTSFAS